MHQESQRHAPQPGSTSQDRKPNEHGTPGNNPHGKPAPTEEQSLKARSCLRWFMVLFVLMLLSSSLLLPWKIICLVTGLGTIVMGIYTLVHLIRFRLPALLKITTSIALIAAIFTTLGAAAMIALWPLTQKYEDCTKLALTIETKNECRESYLTLDGLLPAP